MAPPSTAATEAQLLRSYLLNPASFPTIITLDEFRALFPTRYRSHPQVRLLYRDLQFLRTVDTDLVGDHVAQECRNGERQRREMYRALHAQPHLSQHGRAQADSDKDVVTDEVFYGQTGSVPKRKKNHTTESLFAEMEENIRYLEVDCQVANRDANRLLEDLRHTVGNFGGSGSATASAEDGGAMVGDEAEIVKNLKSLEDAIKGSLIQA